MGGSNFDLSNPLDFSSNAESFLGDTSGLIPGVNGSLMNFDGSPVSSTTSTTPGSSSNNGLISSILNGLSGGSGNTLTALENAGILGSDIFGTIGNIGLSENESQLMNEAMGLASEYSNLNPSQMSSLINQYMTGISGAPGGSFPQILNYFEQPLGQNLTQGVENQVQQSLAAQGLAQSPGIMNAETTQALAPYMLQEQNAAEGLYSNLLNQSSSDLFNQLNLPLSAIGSVRFPPSSPISPLINPATSAAAGTASGLLNSALGGNGSGGGGGLLGSLDNGLSSPIGAGIAGGLAGGLLGATTPGLGGAIQPGVAGALEGAGLGTAISAAAEPIATSLASDVMGSVGGGLLSGLGTGLGGALDTVLGAAVPFIGPLLAVLPFLFQGANPQQVKPAQAQQPFEVGADDIYNAVKAGYLTPAQGDQAIQAIDTSANSQLGSLVNSIMASGGGNQKIANTIPEVNQILANEISSVNALPSETPRSFTDNDLASILMNPSTQGYYTGSVSGGNTLAENLINQMLGVSG